MNNVQQKKVRKKMSFKAIARILIIAIIGIALIIGIIFSSTSFADSYVVGQDFSDRYQAFVGVYNSKAEERPNADNQPTGDAARGAQILSTRLNPLGMKDIRITQAGANYLQVSAPASSYNNIEEFSNSIQRSGSVIMTDSTFSDLQISSSDENTIERTPMSDYFTSAKATTITSGSNKYPYISYALNGSTFKDLVTSKTTSSDSSSEAQEFDMYVFTDLDELFNDVRTYFNFDDSSDKDDRYDDFYTYVLKPLQKVYDESEDETVKGMLYDLFVGRWQVNGTSSNTTSYKYGSLIDTSLSVNSNSGDISRHPTSGTNVEKIFDLGYQYTSKTANYVYSGDAKTEDFADEGKYAGQISIKANETQANGQQAVTKLKVQDAFKSLSQTLLKSVLEDNENSDVQNYFAQNYVLFAGAVATDADAKSTAYFDGDNFYTRVETQSKAKIDASIFNAASEGFSFVSSSVSQVSSTITHTELLISMMILLILVIALFILMVILYRLLALFTIIVALATIAVTLLIMTSFGLTFGLETILGSVILLAISFETTSMLFSLIRHNFFNKKRGIKTSYKIAVKEAIGFGIDLAVTILVSSICLFWIGTNSMKSLATLLSVGSALSIVFTVIVCSIWMLLLVNTNIFDKAKWLFIININPNSSFSLQEYKIGALVTRRDGMLKRNEDVANVNEKIKSLEEKLAAKQGKQDERLARLDEKQISKIEKKIQKIELAIAALRDKSPKENAKAKADLAVAKLQTKIDSLNAKVEKLDAEKDIKQIGKLKFKVAELQKEITKLNQGSNLSVRELKKVHRYENKLEDLRYMHSAEGREIKSEQEETDEKAYTTAEKRQIKNNERVMKLGARILLAIFAVFAALFAAITPTIGAKLDKSFGGAVIYTVWGNSYIQGAENILTDISQDTTLSTDYINKANDLRADLEATNGSSSSSDSILDSVYEKAAESFGAFLVYTMSHYDAYHTEHFGNANIPGDVAFEYTSGINFNLNSGTSTNANDETNMWVSLEVTVANVKGSRAVKQVISKLIGGASETTAVSADQGFTSKRLHPYTNKKMLIQALIVGALAIAILLIYILIRFKWTYYVALALSTIFSFAMIVFSIVVFRINIDLSTITLGIIGFILAVYIGMYVISSIRSIMNRKNEKSLTKFFEKEIGVAVEIKKERRRVRDDIFRKHQAMKVEIKLRKHELSKLEIKNMKAEHKAEALNLRTELKQFTRTKREEVRRESRRNNYLYEVVSEVFTKLWKKLLILAVLAVVITIASIVGLVGNWSNSFIFVIAFSITGLSSLFILIPLWVVIERFRIHNKLASKKFINQIVISQEEQLVEDIND